MNKILISPGEWYSAIHQGKCQSKNIILDIFAN